MFDLAAQLCILRQSVRHAQLSSVIITRKYDILLTKVPREHKHISRTTNIILSRDTLLRSHVKDRKEYLPRNKVGTAQKTYSKKSPEKRNVSASPAKIRQSRAYRSRLLIDLFALARDKRLERGDKILRSGLLLRRRFSSDSRAISTDAEGGGGLGALRGGAREIERKPVYATRKSPRSLAAR